MPQPQPQPDLGSLDFIFDEFDEPTTSEIAPTFDELCDADSVFWFAWRDTQPDDERN